MKRLMFGIAAVVAIISMSFTVASHNGAFKSKSVNSKFAFTCLTTDFDKITDVTVFPTVTYDNTNNGGSAGLPPSADCFTLIHQPTSSFSCNETQTHFCCARSGTACTTGKKVTLHYKS